jgi:hypothetical protein
MVFRIRGVAGDGYGFGAFTDLLEFSAWGILTSGAVG